jgi:hypothetical protein
MIRKLGFGVVLLAACMVVACGRQVSPNPPGLGAGGAPPGYMSIKFDTAGAFNFANYQYWVILNTSGNGLTPLTNPQQNNWAAYSSGIEFTGNGGSTAAVAVQFIKNSNPAIPPHFQPLVTTPQQLQYVPNSNGTGTEVQVIFDRSILNPIQASPSPSPPPLSSLYLFNGFVTQNTPLGTLVFLDSMGQGGATDTSYVSPQLDINTCFDQVYTKLQDINPPSDPAAQIVSVEIANNPSPGPHSSPCP